MADVMAETGHDALDVICDLLLAEDLGVNQVTSGPWAETLPRFVAHPVGMVGTDCTFLGAKPSPRTYGSFPRILGQFVRDERLLSLEEAIRKMTWRRAARLGLRHRGDIRDGAVADLVVFDPATVRSNATYDEPRRFPTGIEQVIVDGTLVVADGDAHRRDAGPGHPPRASTDVGPSGRAFRPATGGARDVVDGGDHRRARSSIASRVPPAQLGVHPLRRAAHARRRARVAGRARPADGQAQRDRARLEPQVAGLADALDVVDGGDLVGLRQQHPEPARPEPREVVGTAGFR